MKIGCVIWMLANIFSMAHASEGNVYSADSFYKSIPSSSLSMELKEDRDEVLILFHEVKQKLGSANLNFEAIYSKAIKLHDPTGPFRRAGKTYIVEFDGKYFGLFIEDPVTPNAPFEERLTAIGELTQVSKKKLFVGRADIAFKMDKKLQRYMKSILK